MNFLDTYHSLNLPSPAKNSINPSAAIKSIKRERESEREREKERERKRERERKLTRAQRFSEYILKGSVRRVRDFISIGTIPSIDLSIY